METHSAAQQGEGVAVAVAVAVVAADKQRQQQHYTHHYVERFSVIDDMGPLRDCLEIPEDLAEEVPPAPPPSLRATLHLPSEGERQSRRHTHALVCSSFGAPHKKIKIYCT